jgi:hypothetical protein
MHIITEIPAHLYINQHFIMICILNHDERRVVRAFFVLFQINRKNGYSFHRHSSFASFADAAKVLLFSVPPNQTHFNYNESMAVRQ